jgi:hypothetical protein
MVIFEHFLVSGHNLVTAFELKTIAFNDNAIFGEHFGDGMRTPAIPCIKELSV